MELVYLWVEDYKNIKKQGFNFSPRFHCVYDEESNELTIDENDDYIPNFFGENINVTAIVGKNGSGKSSLLELIYFKIAKIRDYRLISIFYEYSTGKLLFSKENIKIKRINNNSNFILNKTQIEKFLDYINISYFINEDLYNVTFQNLGGLMYDEKHEVKNVSLHTLDNDCLSNSLHGQRCLKSQIIFEQLKVFGDSKNIDFIEKKFNINRPYYLEINMDSICHAIKSFLGFRMCRNYPLLFELLIGHTSIEEIYYSREEDEQIKIEIREELNKNSIQERERVINNFFEKASETWDGSIQISLKYTKIILEFLNLYKVGEIEAFFTFIYYDKYRRRIDFSSGEQVVIFYLSKIKSLKSSLLIIDEIDVYLHPKWQKDFFSILIQYLDLTKSKIKHLILTTHSPFLLSDIPKQNIIFLDKDEKGNCKVVDGLKEKKQTFGANIHTLLSDSFFMENGLMGEFAKSKIDRAIELLNQEQLNEDELKYCEQIISIIGEPIVKNQLQRMLDSKRLKKVDEIDAIKKSMIAMKQRLDELEK